MQHVEVSCAVRPIYGSLGVKGVSVHLVEINNYLYFLRGWENNIKMDVQEVGGGGGEWMELGQDRDRWRALVSTVKNLRVP
jgi:hypothetical protein